MTKQWGRHDYVVGGMTKRPSCTYLLMLSTRGRCLVAPPAGQVYILHLKSGRPETALDRPSDKASCTLTHTHAHANSTHHHWGRG